MKRNSVHFFKLHSRLGLKNIPNKSSEKNTGVENGPDAVLSEAFVAELDEPSRGDDFVFTDPDSISKAEYPARIAHDSSHCIDLIETQLAEGELQAAIGGDHSVSFATVAALLRQQDPTQVGYIQFDSHGDLHTFATSPSGNFHGMWLRPLVDTVGYTDIDALVPKKLPTSNVMYVGNLDLESEEKDFMKSHDIQVFDRNLLQGAREPRNAKLETFLSRFTHIHVSFDIDVFARDLAPATGTPAPDGLSEEEVFPLLQIIKEHSPSLSIDLVEVNPEKAGAAETTRLAQRVLLSLIK